MGLGWGWNWYFKTEKESEVSMDRGERFVRHALRVGAIEFNEAGYKLKHGKEISPYFCNCKRLNSGEDLDLLSLLYAEAFGPDLVSKCDGVIGPPMAGTILAGPVVMGIWNKYSSNTHLRAYSYRNEIKKHGEGGVLIGAENLIGKKLVAIDDAITRGGSLLNAMRVVGSHGGSVIACVVAFDRQERYAEGIPMSKKFHQLSGIEVRSIASMRDLLICLRDEKLSLPNRVSILRKVEEYAQKNCVVS